MDNNRDVQAKANLADYKRPAASVQPGPEWLHEENEMLRERVRFLENKLDLGSGFGRATVFFRDSMVGRAINTGSEDKGK